MNLIGNTLPRPQPPADGALVLCAGLGVRAGWGKALRSRGAGRPVRQNKGWACHKPPCLGPRSTQGSVGLAEPHPSAVSKGSHV